MDLIFQVWIGEPKDNPVLRPSRDSMKKYANRVGAEYKFFNDYIWDKDYLPQFQCLWMFEEEQDKYDTILYTDTDVCVRIGVTENIFNEPGNALNFTYRNAYEQWHQKAKVRSPQVPADPSIPGFNGGVYKFTREERRALRPAIQEVKEICKDGCFHDEMLLNVAMSKAGFKPSILADKWNWRVELPPLRDPRLGNFYHIMYKKRKELYKRFKKAKLLG